MFLIMDIVPHSRMTMRPCPNVTVVSVSLKCVTKVIAHCIELLLLAIRDTQELLDFNQLATHFHLEN